MNVVKVSLYDPMMGDLYTCYKVIETNVNVVKTSISTVQSVPKDTYTHSE
jgi:hypothetical protein